MFISLYVKIIFLTSQISSDLTQEDAFLVLKMKIWIYWSELNLWIYFYVLNKKNEKFTGLNKIVLVLGRRTGAHCEDWNYLLCDRFPSAIQSCLRVSVPSWCTASLALAAGSVKKIIMKHLTIVFISFKSFLHITSIL